MASKINILKEDDKRTDGYDVQGLVSIEKVVDVLKEAGILVRCENVTDVFLTEHGLSYYATI